MKIKKELIKRDIAGETVLVPVGKTIYDSHGLFVLNELGTFLWALLPGAENADALCDAVLAEYEVSREEAARDISDFLAKLEELGIL